MASPFFRRTISVATVAALLCPTAQGQTLPPAASSARVPLEIRALRTTQAPVIDGRLSEEPWAQAIPVGDFTQRDPDEGKPATERTEVRFLYDNTALYVGVRLFDSQPRLVSERLSMRDGDIDADAVTIYLDPKHDRLTGAMFSVTAANVQRDSILHNDTWTDRN